MGKLGVRIRIETGMSAHHEELHAGFFMSEYGTTPASVEVALVASVIGYAHIRILRCPEIMPVRHGELGGAEQYPHSLVTLSVLPVRAEESQCIVFVKCCLQVLLGLSADFLHSEDIECIVLYGGNQPRKSGAPDVVGILVKVGHSDIVSAYPELG